MIVEVYSNPLDWLLSLTHECHVKFFLLCNRIGLFFSSLALRPFATPSSLSLLPCSLLPWTQRAKQWAWKGHTQIGTCAQYKWMEWKREKPVFLTLVPNALKNCVLFMLPLSVELVQGCTFLTIQRNHVGRQWLNACKRVLACDSHGYMPTTCQCLL